MDRRVKERLVGAIVLVLLGVWLIPWLLDGQQPGSEPAAQNAAIRLPVPAAARPAGTQAPRTRTIEIDVARGTANPVEPAAAASSTEEPAAAHETQDRVADAGVVREAIERSKPAADAGRSAAAKGSQTQAADDVTAGWMVQLGSFGDKGNATRQAERVKTFGYEPRISSYSASGRPMYRVRVGPVESRERAEAAVSALSAHGFVAQIMAPE